MVAKPSQAASEDRISGILPRDERRPGLDPLHEGISFRRPAASPSSMSELLRVIGPYDTGAGGGVKHSNLPALVSAIDTAGDERIRGAYSARLKWRLSFFGSPVLDFLKDGAPSAHIRNASAELLEERVTRRG